MTNPRRLWTPGAAALAATILGVGLVVAVFTHPSESAGPPALETVDPVVLKSFGLELHPPSAPNPISKASAEAAAKNQYRSNRILESVLADCAGQQVDGTCWVVSMDPAGLTTNAGGASHPRKPQPMRFLIVVVDAQSGEFLRSLSGT
jgi:hypothetical protein